jgi:hypothetical protein
MPAGVGRTLPQEVQQHDRHGMEAVVGVEEGLVPAGNLAELDDKLTISKPGMVGAEVADVGQHVQPAPQHELVRPKMARDGIALAAKVEACIKSRQGAERKCLHHHP